MSNEELAAVKNGDKAAFEKLLGSYEVLIRAECAAIIRKFPDFRDEEEELLQEGRLALYSAAMRYLEQDGVTFGLYAKICIKNRLISYIRKLISAKKRRDKAAEKEASGSGSGSSAEQIAIAFENSEKLRALVHSEASRYEETVFSLYLEKKSYEEIAQIVGKDVKSVANAICRVKSKLKRRLK